MIKIFLLMLYLDMRDVETLPPDFAKNIIT